MTNEEKADRMVSLYCSAINLNSESERDILHAMCKKYIDNPTPELSRDILDFFNARLPEAPPRSTKLIRPAFPQDYADD